MAKGLRFSSIATMPESIRRAAERATRVAAVPAVVEKADVARKYHNQPTRVDGIRFDSKREARYYQQLRFEQQSGSVRYFLRQVPMHLPGGTKLVVDFMVVMADGRVRFVDAKGRETQAFKIKRREVQHHYPIALELV